MVLGTLLGVFICIILPFLIFQWFIASIIMIFLLFFPFEIPCLRRLWLWKRLQKRLHYNVIQETSSPEDADYTKQVVFAVQPHGHYCLSIMLTWVMENTDSPLSKGKRRVIPLVSSSLLRVPILGALARMMGCQSIDRDNYQTHLASSCSIAIAPGGAREAMYSDTGKGNKIQMLRRHRYTWIEYAMYNNTDIVPILSIGEASGYRMYPSWQGLQKLSYKLTGWCFPILNFGAKYAPWWPNTTGVLTLVVGNKLKFGEYDSPAQLADAYYKELERLATTQNCEIEYIRDSNQ